MNKLLKSVRKRSNQFLLTSAALGGSIISSTAMAAVDQTKVDAAMASGATDVAYIGGGFMILLIGVVVWSYLRRTAK